MKNSALAKKNSSPFNIVAVDLFCGAGGLTYGLQKKAIKVRAGFDIDSNCKYAFEENNESLFISKDVTDVKSSEISSYFKKGEITVIAGCAPCQPFSKYTQGKDNSQDKKWSMLYQFARLVKDIQPDIVTMENVPQLRKHSVYDDFVRELEDLGYQVDTKIVFCPDYNIPQTRQRLVLLASKLGPIKLIPPTTTKDNYKTVKMAIGGLSPIKAGEQCRKDHLHVASAMSETNFKRIKSSKQNGSWLDWDESLVADCHKKEGRQTYRSVYGRMSWDKPSPTITTQFTGFGNGRFGHPEQDRAISVREGAILQTFPKKYKFAPAKQKINMHNVRKMIGNAVPVRLGEVIGSSINQHVKLYGSKKHGSLNS